MSLHTPSVDNSGTQNCEALVTFKSYGTIKNSTDAYSELTLFNVK